MKRVLFTMTEQTHKILKETSERLEISMSRIVENATLIYALMSYSNNGDSIKHLNELVPKGQTDIFQFLEKETKKHKS
jgi:hypothetical protein